MKNTKRAFGRHLQLSPVVCALLGTAGAASAQSTAAAPPEAASASAPAGSEAGPTRLVPEPAKVPKEESGLPLTKVVVDRKQIESGAEQEGYTEAVKNVPGAMNNNGKGNANDALRFRGLQLGLFSNYRINGGLAITNVVTVPTEDKEKVEALKGANALMFGLASPAGILNLVTKRPREVATATVSGNSFGQYGAAVDLGHRWGEDRQYGIRLNAAATHIETGTDGMSGTSDVFGFAGDWNPTRKLSIKVDFEDYMRNVVEQGGVVPPTAAKGVIAVPKVPDPRRLLSGTWDIYDPHTQNSVLRADYKVADNWSVSAEGGESFSTRDRTQVRIVLTDPVTGDGQQNVVFAKGQRFKNTYEKVETHGSITTGWLRNDVTLGFSSAERDNNGASTYSPAGANNNRGINIYDPVALSAPVDPQTKLTFKPTVSKDSGPYAYDTISLGSDFRFLVGVRKTKYDFSQTLVANGPSTTTHYTPTTKGYGILYEFAPRSTVYASYMQSMEDGSIVPIGPIQGKTVTNANAVLTPAVSTQKEVGLRSAYFDSAFINIDYFDIAKKNTNFIPDGPNSVVDQYDGDLHLSGVEIQANGQLNRWWSLSGSAQIMKAVQEGGANDGFTTENTPRSILSGNVEYRVPGVKGLAVKAGTSYVSTRYIGNSQQGEIPSVTLFTAGASYDTRTWGHRTTYIFGIDNLANRRYWASATSSAFGPGMDRSFRISMKTDL
ncbi:MAG: TonB-dependent receptor plug domain-containing protein [Pseudomonadota bacterium]|nr:TonB-dependent receptor plug domain-containing protein [Pseudomonadota bacterium]